MVDQHQLIPLQTAVMSIVDQHGATTIHYAAQSNSDHPHSDPAHSGADTAGGPSTLRALFVGGLLRSTSISQLDPDLTLTLALNSNLQPYSKPQPQP